MRRSSDPTSDDSDFMPLDPEDLNLVNGYLKKAFAIIIILGLINYKLWK